MALDVKRVTFSFILIGSFYELNLSVFNSIFGIPSSMDLLYCYVPKEFILSAFWYDLSGDYRYDTSNSKETVIRNPCICMVQRLLACGLFTWEDSLNVSRQSKFYFLYGMFQDDQIDPGSLLVNQLHSATTRSKHSIMIRGLITPIAWSVGRELNPNHRIPGYELLNLVAFEYMKFYMVEAGSVCWIYLGNRLMPLPSVDRTTLLNRTGPIFTFYWVMMS